MPESFILSDLNNFSCGCKDDENKALRVVDDSGVLLDPDTYRNWNAGLWLSKNENHNIVHNDVVLDKQKLGRLQSSSCDVFGGSLPEIMMPTVLF